MVNIAGNQIVMFVGNRYIKEVRNETCYIMLYQIDLVMSCSNPFLCRVETVADDEFVWFRGCPDKGFPRNTSN
jgi:hypothetical protein